METDRFDRRYILYNIRLIHILNTRLNRAIEYYFALLERNPKLLQSLNNVAVIYHFQKEQALYNYQTRLAKIFFRRASEYWKIAIQIAPVNYIIAQNWLHIIKIKRMLSYNSNEF